MSNARPGTVPPLAKWEGNIVYALSKHGVFARSTGHRSFEVTLQTGARKPRGGQWVEPVGDLVFLNGTWTLRVGHDPRVSISQFREIEQHLR